MKFNLLKRKNVKTDFNSLIDGCVIFDFLFIWFLLHLCIFVSSFDVKVKLGKIVMKWLAGARGSCYCELNHISG